MRFLAAGAIALLLMGSPLIAEIPMISASLLAVNLSNALDKTHSAENPQMTVVFAIEPSDLALVATSSTLLTKDTAPAAIEQTAVIKDGEEVVSDAVDPNLPDNLKDNQYADFQSLSGRGCGSCGDNKSCGSSCNSCGNSCNSCGDNQNSCGDKNSCGTEPSCGDNNACDCCCGGGGMGWDEGLLASGFFGGGTVGGGATTGFGVAGSGSGSTPTTSGESPGGLAGGNETGPVNVGPVVGPTDVGPPVPEPSTYLLLGAMAAVVLYIKRRRSRYSSSLKR